MANSNANARRGAAFNRTIFDARTQRDFTLSCDKKCNCNAGKDGKASIDHKLGVPYGLNQEKFDPDNADLPYNAHVTSLDCAAFQSNGEWDILDGKVDIRVKDNKQIIRYSIVLNRKPLFYRDKRAWYGVWVSYSKMGVKK